MISGADAAGRNRQNLVSKGRKEQTGKRRQESADGKAQTGKRRIERKKTVRTMIGIFDTHAHYDDEAFDTDRDELLNSMEAGGIVRIVNAASSLATTRSTLALTERYPFVYGAAGVHPDEIEELDETAFGELAELAQGDRIAAIGEIGLDYYVPPFILEDPEQAAVYKNEAQREKQRKWFIRQLDLARQLGKPVVIHSRDAARDTLDIVKREAVDLCCDIHCFSYGVELAREYLTRGHYLGIGGVVTFKNSRKMKEVVAYMPLDRILLETDCPYLAPVPHRGKRNSSLNLPYVVSAIAQIKGVSEEKVIETTWENAMRFYQMSEGQRIGEAAG